ncbi:MAG: hypothetical protein DRR19_32570, partial [Candidatus Parabeggiatoa sp. nov. 1]
TAWHSTVFIPESEQNQFEINLLGLFRLNNEAKAQCLRWDNDMNQVIFTGEHYYGVTGIKHIREIRFDKQEQQITIKDSLYDTLHQLRNLKGFFVLHTPPYAILSGVNNLLSINNTQIRAENGQKWLIENSLYSTHYGATQLSKRAVMGFIDNICVIISIPKTTDN